MVQNETLQVSCYSLSNSFIYSGEVSNIMGEFYDNIAERVWQVYTLSTKKPLKKSTLGNVILMWCRYQLETLIVSSVFRWSEKVRFGRDHE